MVAEPLVRVVEFYLRFVETQAFNLASLREFYVIERLDAKTRVGLEPFNAPSPFLINDG